MKSFKITDWDIEKEKETEKEITISFLQDSLMHITQSAIAERQREDIKDNNQRLNPLNLQLSRDSTDTLDPSSPPSLFRSDEGNATVISPKVLTTNPDDPSLPPTSHLHPFICFRPSLVS